MYCRKFYYYYFMKVKPGILITGLILLLLILPDFAIGQLSPGELNQKHADLEGLKNCEKCHQAGQQISSQKCLACHTILRDRIISGKGLHANNGFEDCVACHVEHLGRGAELIWWMEDIDKFDHAQTGYALIGKHAGLECRRCHKMENIAHKAKLTAARKDLKRTYLGLNPNCLSCHIDEHRGQVAADCLNCHTMDGWKPPTKFNHALAAFALTGKHQTVDCAKCHKTITDNKYEKSPDFLQLVNIPHETCLYCHTDIHRGRFDKACAECHNTTGWGNINRAEFDHSKTQFPLEGKHAAVACAKCHIEGKPIAGLKYGLCSDCHADYHQGQFADRESHGECKECHTVNGFSPANFSLDEHQKTAYPLLGSHLAVPCVACHKPSTLPTGSETIRFTFVSTRCLDCHSNPHRNEVDKYLAQGGCEYCHSVESWQAVSYDHSLTGFPLEGKHKAARCSACHLPKGSENILTDMHFIGIDKNCTGCHTDIHRGQFSSQVNAADANRALTACGKCHSFDNWQPSKFVHDRDAAFKLEGAHRNVACGKCHQKIERDGQYFTWFKPIDTECRHCHGENELNLKEGDS